jgi:hypothetical protein
MPDFLEALGADVLEEAAEQRSAIEGGGAGARTAHCPGGDGDRAGLQRDDTAVGDSDAEDSGGTGGAGRVAGVMGLPVDVPGAGPDLGGDVLQQSSLAHVCLEECAGDGGEGFDRDTEVGTGGAPGRAGLGEAAAGHNVMEVRGGREVPPPGVQAPGEPRQVGPDEALGWGQPRESRCRRLQQGLGREALMRAEAGSQRLRDGAGAEAVRPGQLFVQGVR